MVDEAEPLSETVFGTRDNKKVRFFDNKTLIGDGVKPSAKEILPKNDEINQDVEFKGDDESSHPGF